MDLLKSCFRCKYYDYKKQLCRWNFSEIEIINEYYSGNDCKCFKVGRFNENDLIDRNSIIGYLRY